jgi:hypothetical protein
MFHPIYDASPVSSTAERSVLLAPNIGDEWDYLERTFIYIICTFQLVWLMHMRITIVLVKFFLSVRGVKMEQRAMIMFCVKVNKTATEAFEKVRAAKNVYQEMCV